MDSRFGEQESFANYGDTSLLKFISESSDNMVRRDAMMQILIHGSVTYYLMARVHSIGAGTEIDSHGQSS